MTATSGSRGAGLVLAGALAAAGFFAWTWPLASHLRTHTIVHAAAFRDDAAASLEQSGFDLILANDQDLSLWGAADNARALLRGDPVGLVDQGQCWPMPHSTALGEHMIDLGLLAMPGLVATGDPVAAYNLSFLAALVLAALGMFLFLHRHTASVAASLAGAIAFAFATPRLVDLPYHPAVIGTHWIPWVLWSFDGILAGGGLASGAAFALTLLLACVVGSYPLMAVGLTGACYGGVRLAQQRRAGAAMISLLARCTASALPALVVAGALLATYSGLQAAWSLVVNPDAKYLVSAADFLPGALLSAGIGAFAGLVGLFFRRRDEGRDAVLGLVVATLVTFALTTRLPVGEGWSLYETLARHVALLDSVRAPGKIALAVCFGLQALGAIGWSRVFATIDAPLRWIVAALLVAVVAVEANPPAWTGGLLGSGAAVALREVAPPASRLDTLAAAFGDPRDRRAVLDLPTGRMVKAPLALLDAAYHGHPTAACYNSLIPPTMRATYQMAARSHGERGIAELAAAGFGFVIERPSSPSASLSPTSFPPPARLVAFDKDIAVWALPDPGPVHGDATKLSLVVNGGATRSGSFAPEPPHELDVEVTNRADTMWAAPRPLEPLVAHVELKTGDGHVLIRTRARGVWPLALAAGATTTVQLVMPEAPYPGTYVAMITIEGAPAPLVVPSFHWSDESR